LLAHQDANRVGLARTKKTKLNAKTSLSRPPNEAGEAHLSQLTQLKLKRDLRAHLSLGARTQEHPSNADVDGLNIPGQAFLGADSNIGR
jgi:hypothetical protein